MKSATLRNLAAFSLLLVTPTLAKDQDKAPPEIGVKDTKATLQGAWILKLEDGSQRLKIIADGRWMITQSDPDTGAVVFHHGGSYTFDGETYVEKVEYANMGTAELIGQKFTFKITMRKNAFHQEGVGNPFTEDWTRAGR